MALPVEEITKYLNTNGLRAIQFHGVRYAFGFRENEPVIAIMYDFGDGSSKIQDVMSLYWATADYITKPWCLILVTREKMNPQSSQIVKSLASQYNIKILENQKNDEILTVVREQLDQLKTIMQRYVSINNPSALGESIKTWKNETPILEDRYSVDVQLGSLFIYESNGTLSPNRTTVPLMAVSGEAEIEGILPRLVQSEPYMIFFTEHRNLPVVIKLELPEKPILTLRFEADKGNLIEATNFESLVMALNLTKEISFIEPNTGENVFKLSVREHVK